MALTIDKINNETLAQKLSEYSTPENLRDLDRARYELIPATIAKRQQEGKEVYLIKEEVHTLIEWKLYSLSHFPVFFLALNCPYVPPSHPSPYPNS
jgi:hypothetical protein